MAVLIVEDDSVMQELLATLVRSHDHDVPLFLADTVSEALERWRAHPLKLVLCDLNLSGAQNGMDVVREVRASGDPVPIVLITGNSDRATVVDGARNRVNGYIVKPFEPEVVAERLKPFLLPEPEEVSLEEAETLCDWLSDLDARFPHLSIASSESAELAQLQSDGPVSVRELTMRWDDDVSVSTRLIQVANNQMMKRKGQAVETLLEAINVLGVEMSAKLILAEKIRHGDQLQHPYLKQLAEQYAERSVAIAGRAVSLAHRLQLDVALCYTAGIMAYLGEQVLLEAIQRFVDEGEKVETRDIDEAISRFAAPYGNYVKVQWRIPLALRERVGAIHKVPDGTVKTELILMRAAACQEADQTDTPEYAKLVRQLGLDVVEPRSGTSSLDR